VDDVLLGDEEVGHLLLVQDGRQVELLQVLPEEAVHHRHILLGHRPHALRLGGLGGQTEVNWVPWMTTKTPVRIRVQMTRFKNGPAWARFIAL